MKAAAGQCFNLISALLDKFFLIQKTYLFSKEDFKEDQV